MQNVTTKKLLLGALVLIMIALGAYIARGGVGMPAAMTDTMDGESAEMAPAMDGVEDGAMIPGDESLADPVPEAQPEAAAAVEAPAPVACPADAKLCPSGDYVSRSGPNCSFAPCPALIDMELVNPEPACTMDVKECPDGSFVGREGANCEFAACPAVELQLQISQ